MVKFRLPRNILFAAACCLSLCASPAFAFRAVPVGTFSNPVDMRVAPGQPNRLYVVEQPGQIKILQNETPVAAPFLNIESIVNFDGEQGLLSLAFAPDYATSRRFYVLFVNNNGNVEVDEFLRSPTNPLRTEAGSRRVVLRIPHPNAGNHNGGQLQFSPDGYLYISIGDGGNTSTPGEPARDLRSLLGKVLRINPLPGGGRAYQIPPDNPYVGVFGRDEIYAYGLRNPWRMAIMRNLIMIGDVGQSRREEINILRIPAAKGVNFGWPQFEGNLVYDNSKPGPDPAVFPIRTYGRGVGCATIGGHIVTDIGLPALQGRYIYGDLCSGQIRSFLPDVIAQNAIGDGAVRGVSLPGLRSFGRGRDGQVYMSDSTRVYRLEP